MNFLLRIEEYIRIRNNLNEKPFNTIMQRFEAIILFYKPLFLWSFVANIVIALFNPLLFQAFIAKLFLTIFARYYVIQSDTKQKLITFKSLGISEFKLYSFLYIIDVCIMSIYLVLIKEFI